MDANPLDASTRELRRLLDLWDSIVDHANTMPAAAHAHAVQVRETPLETYKTEYPGALNVTPWRSERDPLAL